MAKKTLKHAGGFTLVELLVTLAVVLILISAVSRMGQYVRTRSSIQLTQSALAVIETALQQYYDDFGNKFPFSTDTFPLPTVADPAGGDGVSDPYRLSPELRNDLGAALGITVVVNAVDLLEKDGKGFDQPFASSAGLFWFLYRSANSRQIIDAVTSSLVAVKHPQETQQKLTATVGGVVYDLPRFIDPWGMSLRYAYAPKADTFPKVLSAGPDKVFGTPDDIENK